MNTARRWCPFAGPFGFALCLVPALLFGLFLTIETDAATTHGTDYFYYWTVGKLILSGHPGAIYDLHALGTIERALARPVRVPGGVIPNVYPPFFAVLFVPLAALPYSLGYLLWLGMNCLLLAAAVFQLERLAGLSGRGRLIFRLLVFLSLPVIVALLQGQVSLILLAALTGSFLAMRSGHDGWAGALLAGTMVKPQFALPLLLVLLLQRRFRVLAAFAAVAAALTLLPLLVLGPAALPNYLHTLLAATTWGTSVGGFAPHWNRSFAGFTQLLLPGPVASPLAWLLDLAALAVLARVALTAARLETPFALGVVVTLLATQHVLIHDLTLLALPAAVALSLRAEGPRRLVPLLIAADVVITAGFKLALVVPVQLPTLAVLAVAIWLWRAAGNETRTAETAPSRREALPAAAPVPRAG